MSGEPRFVCGNQEQRENAQSLTHIETRAEGEFSHSKEGTQHRAECAYQRCFRRNCACRSRSTRHLGAWEPHPTRQHNVRAMRERLKKRMATGEEHVTDLDKLGSNQSSTNEHCHIIIAYTAHHIKTREIVAGRRANGQMRRRGHRRKDIKKWCACIHRTKHGCWLREVNTGSDRLTVTGT